MFKMFLVVSTIVFATGCGLEARTYVMTKERVGIEKGSGNAGYLAGTPQYIEPQKKTRQMYVLEITKPVAQNEIKKIEQTVGAGSEPAPTSAPVAMVPAEAPNKNVTAPPVAGAAPAPTVPSGQAPTEASGTATTYTVQKDDTLQKIAKKFYGSYGKWVKIYEANRDKIKNPNYLKPRTVLTIPAEK